MILVEDVNLDSLYIIDSFANARLVSGNLKLFKFFKEVKFFGQRKDAIYCAAKKKPKKLFIDSDVGLRPYLNLFILKIRSNSTLVMVYEEGVGVCRVDLIVGFLKKIIYGLIGVGVNFGGCVFTNSIFLFNEKQYAKVLPRYAHKAMRIPTTLMSWIKINRDDLIIIFCDKYNIDGIFSGAVANLYLADWSLNIKLIEEISSNSTLFVKPHPHTKNGAVELIKRDRVFLLPAGIPAELIILDMLDKFEIVNVYNSNSSALIYIKDEKLKSLLI